MITTFTIDALIDAGLSAEAFRTIKAAFDLDIENARNDVREHIVTTDAGSATPAAVRMRKMREKRRLLEASASSQELANDANTVTSQGVTSHNNLSKEVLKKEEIKKERKTVKRNSYGGEFEVFWGAFPTDPGMSKSETHKVWEKLSLEEQGRAISAIPAFKIWAAKQGPSYRMVHACRYLSQRRFDGFHEAKAPHAGPKQEFLEVDSPDFDAWVKHNGKRPPVIQVQRNGRLVSGWYFPSRLPPTHSTIQPKNSEAA